MTADLTLVARDVGLSECASGVRLSCRLAGDPEAPATLWFEFPAAVAPLVVRSADPFFPVLVLAAMRHRRRLVVEDDVSAALLSSVPRIMTILEEWSTDTDGMLRAVEVSAPARARERPGMTSGAFFSGGVDSSFTLFRNAARYPGDDSRSITHLILAWGFDIALTQGDLFDHVRQRATAVAEALGKTLVPVKTNLRAVLHGMDWGQWGHGAAVASVGLALGGGFHTVFIPASDAFVFLHLPPWGSHPALDPLWSTEQVEFVCDGGEVRRIDKVRFLATRPLALRHLRVCFEGDAYNCGRCSKCLRTMIDLDLFGALDQAEEFPHHVDLGQVERTHIAGWLGQRYWLETLREMRRLRADPVLIRAVDLALARSAWAESRLGRIDAAVMRTLSRIGVTPDRIKAADRVLLGGAGQALARRLYAGRHRMTRPSGPGR